MTTTTTSARALRVRSRRAPRVQSVGVIGVVILAGVAVLLGASAAVLLLACLASCMYALRSRTSLPAAVALAIVGVLGAVFAALVVAHLLPVRAPLVLVVLVCAALGVLAQLLPDGPDTPLAGRRDAGDLLAAGAGSIVWLGTLLLSSLVQGSAKSWMLYGDTANIVLFARQLIEGGGVDVTSTDDPVPFTAALVATFILPGRSLGAPSVTGDVGGMWEMWVFVIALACLLCGLLVRALVPTRSASSTIAMAVCSLAPLTWFATGASFQRGFVSVHLTLVLVVAAAIIALCARSRPALSVGGLAVACTLVLVTWSPLVVMTGLMLLTVLVRERRRVLTRRAVPWLLLAAAQLMAVLLLLSLPSLASLSGVLATAEGGVFTYRRSYFAAIAVLWLLSAIWFGLRRDRVALPVMAAIPVGGVLGLAVLIWLRRGEETIWGYYTLKIAWLVSLLALICAVALATAAARRIVTVLLATAVAGVAFAGAQAAWVLPSDFHAAMARSPVVRILAGEYSFGGGDHLLQEVVRHTTAEPRTIPWKSGDPDEHRTLFWVIQMAAPSPQDEDLRIFAYRRSLDSMADLCTIRELIGAPVTVETADPTIAEGVRTECPALGDVVLRTAETGRG